MKKKDKVAQPKEALTDFGFYLIPEGDKDGAVKEVFDEVAAKYDRMNDLLSFGLHRAWKRHTRKKVEVKDNMVVLDVAGGTGDMTIGLARNIKNGEFVLTDINAKMLAIGRHRIERQNLKGVCYSVCNAECLPFKDESFDVVTVTFGLRNMTHKDLALKEMFRVCKKGGQLLVLEFSKVAKWLAPLYDFYSFQIMPRVAGDLVGQPENYRYLVESIRMHPDQKTLAKIIENAGWHNVSWENLTFGITALHIGHK
ncbi:MAG: class I SAM-dependent methyltransferase [Burkholderiales bacterium]|nr:class I SAM-dependent methyltransferase [Burkholderiales bacterium]